MVIPEKPKPKPKPKPKAKPKPKSPEPKKLPSLTAKIHHYSMFEKVVIGNYTDNHFISKAKENISNMIFSYSLEDIVD